MSNVKTILCYLLALFFFVAGITHFTQDEAYAGIVPPLLPFPFIIQVTPLKDGTFQKIKPSHKTALKRQRNRTSAMASTIKTGGLILDLARAQINLNASFYQNYRSPKG